MATNGKLDRNTAANPNAWSGSIDLGKIGKNDITKTVTLATAGKYVDEDIIISATAQAPTEVSPTSAGFVIVQESDDTLTLGGIADTLLFTGMDAANGTASIAAIASSFTETVNMTFPSGYVDGSYFKTATGAALMGVNLPLGYVNISGNVDCSTLSGVALSSSTVGTGNGSSPYYIDLRISLNDSIDMSNTSISVGPNLGDFFMNGASLNGGFIGDPSQIQGGLEVTGNKIDKIYIQQGNIFTADGDDGNISDYFEIPGLGIPEGGYLCVSEGYVPSAKVSLETLAGSASIGVAVNDAGLEDYTENTDAVVPASGYLYISEGYIPNTKISLATLVPDYANIGVTKGLNTILAGTTVYDKDGVLCTGTMQTFDGSYTLA